MQKKTTTTKKKAIRGSVITAAVLAAFNCTRATQANTGIVWTGANGNSFAQANNWYKITAGSGTPAAITGNNLFFGNSWTYTGTSQYAGPPLPSFSSSTPVAIGGESALNPWEILFGGAATDGIVIGLTQSLTLGTPGDSITLIGNAGTGLSVSSLTVNAQVVQANIDLAPSSGGLTFTDAEPYSSGSFLTVSGTISSTSGTGVLTVNGAGLMELTGSNTYGGGTTIAAGTLVAGISSATGAGAFGPSADTVTLGNVSTTTNNSSPSLLIGGAYTVANPITIANQSTSGTYSIGGNTDANSTFSGPITLNQALTVVSQGVAANSHAVSITGGISSAGGPQTVTFAGPGVAHISTAGISDGSGTVAVKVTGGIADLAASNTYSGNTTISGGQLAISGSIASNTVTLDATTFSPILTLLSATALSSSSNIVVLTGGGTPTIYLDLASTSVSPVPTQTVNTFEVGGTYLTAGIYNASNDPSLFATDPGYEGNLDVATTGSTPEPASLSLIGVGSSVLLARRRRDKKPSVFPS